ARHVPDVDVLVGQDVGGLEQETIQSQAALVIDVGLGDGGAVQLGLEHRARERHAGTSGADGDWRPWYCMAGRATHPRTPCRTPRGRKLVREKTTPQGDPWGADAAAASFADGSRNALWELPRGHVPELAGGAAGAGTGQL